MTEFLIKVEDSAPKRQVTLTVDGKEMVSVNIKVRNEQVLDNLTRFFLQCVREDINTQDEIEKKENGIWK